MVRVTYVHFRGMTCRILNSLCIEFTVLLVSTYWTVLQWQFIFLSASRRPNIWIDGLWEHCSEADSVVSTGVEQISKRKPRCVSINGVYRCLENRDIIKCVCDLQHLQNCIRSLMDNDLSVTITIEPKFRLHNGSRILGYLTVEPVKSFTSTGSSSSRFRSQHWTLNIVGIFSPWQQCSNTPS